MRFVEANGTRIAADVTGTGTPVVLVHGNEADHTMFAGFAPLLAARHTVIAYDQRDSGRTTNPDSPYSLAEMGDDLAGLIAGLGYERAHVFGTSLGGLIAQAAAARHAGRIDRLVLASTFRIGKTVGEFNPGALEWLRVHAADREKHAGETARRYFFPPAVVDARPELVDMFRRQTRTPEQSRRRAALLAGGDRYDLGDITAPTLVMAGSDDRLIPCDLTLSLAAEIPGARTAVLDGVGHVGTIQAPERVAAVVLDFLAGR
ncbi:MAG: alpha/beta fold hydrolase [Alphaproteobacteria bacterium]